MAHYQVSNSKSAHSFGIYAADSAEAAIEAACIDAGYNSKADAEAAMGRESELVAVDVSAEEYAADFDLFAQYIDPDGVTGLTRETFEAEPIERRIALAREVIALNA
jgi:hypothetical protein